MKEQHEAGRQANERKLGKGTVKRISMHQVGRLRDIRWSREKSGGAWDIWICKVKTGRGISGWCMERTSRQAHKKQDVGEGTG